MVLFQEHTSRNLSDLRSNRSIASSAVQNFSPRLVLHFPSLSRFFSQFFHFLPFFHDQAHPSLCPPTTRFPPSSAQPSSLPSLSIVSVSELALSFVHHHRNRLRANARTRSRCTVWPRGLRACVHVRGFNGPS